MKRIYLLATAVLLISTVCTKTENHTVKQGFIIDHSCTDLDKVPSKWISKAREDLHIAYGHSSHGSQITEGMKGLATFKGDDFSWNNGGTGDALDLHDYAMPGDLGNPDRTQWASETRQYLAQHNDVNVIMWAWCGQVSSATESDISLYLGLMSSLEEEFHNVTFVYMTGHLDGTGLDGNLHKRNEQIREYCRINNKVLYDFADIESYDPKGNFFGDKYATDGCNYDFNGDGITMAQGDPALPVEGDRNWAIDWQESNVKGVDWYYKPVAHTQPLNGNLKAYAAWHLWARLAGWDGN